MTRIGVLGGTFDPVHVGHLVSAVNVRHQLELDEVRLVVANDPWQKAGTVVASAEDRLAMVEAAVSGVVGVVADDSEIRRGGPSYTADTLRALADSLPGVTLFLVIGSDVAGELDTWKRAEEIRSLATLVVVARPGADDEVPPPGWAYERVEVPAIQVSASDLRDRFADGRPVEWLVPEPVCRVIRARRLYGSGR
jgi:nicotinate-nucleotide adenylyltransferase